MKENKMKSGAAGFAAEVKACLAPQPFDDVTEEKMLSGWIQIASFNGSMDNAAAQGLHPKWFPVSTHPAEFLQLNLLRANIQ